MLRPQNKPQKYPLGIQTFSKIREQNYLYIDKTALVHDLIGQGEVYFLARPRRFGKSLLVSTFEALFLGQKVLFEGLAIADTDYDFAEYPVISMEFSKVHVTDSEDVKQYIINNTNKYAKHYDIELEISAYEQRFDELVSKLQIKTGRKVVLLIDEYDKPIIDNLLNDSLSQIKSVIAGFYSVVKSLDKYLRFTFITGVTKFAKVSVFSGMNSLRDISMNRQYATLCGITQHELDSNFMVAIDEQASLEDMDRGQMLAKIKHWYNGYRFHHSADGVYNPFSLLSLFLNQEFENYWYTTGTPTFLMNLLKNNNYDLKNLSHFEMGASGFTVTEPENMDVQSVFVQSGYLTIKAYNAPLYTLDFPNYEVKKSFYESVVGNYSHLNSGPGETYIHKLVQQINAGQLDDFFTTLSVFFANIPFDLNVNHEKYYQSLFYAIFTLLGLRIDAEVHTNEGKIDCVLQTDNTVYIIEFKLNDTKEAALQQIHDKKYAQKYQGGFKEIILLGVEFDQKTRNIGEFIRA
jgi:hypothetical protein